MRSVLQFDIQNITGSSVDPDGFPSYSVDVDGERGSVPFEAQYFHGIRSCPLDPVIDPGSGEPVPSKACPVLTAIEGGKGHGFALCDPRSIANLPNCVPGETIVFSDFGSFQRHDKDGIISDSTTTTGGGSDGQTVASQTAPTAHRRFAPWGREVFDASGYSLNHVGGGSFTVAYAGGLIPGLSSYARLKADMVEINGAAVSIGPTGALHQPVAQAQPLIVILQSMITAVAALAAGVAAITAGAGPAPVGAPASAAAALPIAAAQAAIATAMLTISTQTAIG